MTLQEAYDMTESTWEKVAALTSRASFRCGYCAYHNAKFGEATDCSEYTCPLWAALGNQCTHESCYMEWHVSRTGEAAAKVLSRLRELKYQLLEESC